MPIKFLTHRPASLALRVTAFVGLATVLVFFAFGMIVVRSLDDHFVEQDAEELRGLAETIQKPLRELGSGADATQVSRQFADAVTRHHAVFFYVADASGKTLYASPGPDLARIAANTRPAASVEAQSLKVVADGGQFYRTAVLRYDLNTPAASAHYTVVVASDMAAHVRYIEHFQQTLWLTTLAVCLIALLAAWLAVRQGHAPIRKISAQLREITSSELHVRLLPQDVPIELAGLVASFNDMLGRLEDGFRQLSNFSADIAHELRTPVTNLTTETEVALRQARGVEEYREILYSNLEEFERMRMMIADMLFLAKTENNNSLLNLQDVDLAKEVNGLFEFFEAWAEDRGVTLRLEGAASKVQGDPLMLRRALSNLLSNAIRYTQRGCAVTVRLTSQNGGTLIAAENPGDDIAAEHLPHLFERFYRVDPSRQRQGEGAGLGLAIVKSIVEAHHGEVRALSTHGVTRFEITLPKPARF
jgi:two-component system heavy metal sensor histidine kinase CusS